MVCIESATVDAIGSIVDRAVGVDASVALMAVHRAVSEDAAPVGDDLRGGVGGCWVDGEGDF